MKRISLTGRVFSGSGEGAKFVELPWVKEQIAKKLGFTPYPGTLNIKLNQDNATLKNLLTKARLIEIVPAEGFCRGRLVEASFMGDLKCAVIFPEVKNYPKDVIEVVAPVSLRKLFNLKDGDLVEVNVAV